MISLQSPSMGSWFGFLFWFSPKLGILLQALFLPSNPVLCSLQDQKHFQACAAAAGCASTFPTSTVSLMEQIARDTKSLLISLSLKTSGCFSRCHTLKIPSGMQEAASGPGAEPRAQRHPEREAQLTSSASPEEHNREKGGKKQKKNHTTVFLIN